MPQGVAEKCTCGHLKGDHYFSIKKGHAQCQWDYCNCERFDFLETLSSTIRSRHKD